MGRRRHFKIDAAILLIAFFGALYWQRVTLLDWYRVWQKPALPAAVTYEDVVQQQVLSLDVETPSVEEPLVPADVVPDTTTPPETAPEEIVENILPVSINLAVPFTAQAPSGNWDLPFEEACEEASIYMADLFYAQEPEGQVATARAEAEILKIVEFEKSLFGYYEDTTIEQTGLLLEQMYGRTVELVEKPTIDDLKKYLVAGHPVIVPTFGQALGNPYYQQPGPVYHMLVLRGYTKDGFITNDPGTRHGEAYFYTFDRVMDAMHDWNNGNVEQGKKAVLVVTP